MTRSFPAAGSGAGRRAVGLRAGLWGSVWVVCLVAVMIITGCAGPASDTDQDTVAAVDEPADGGYTREEQLREVALALVAMEEHFGAVGFRDLSDDADVDDVGEQVRPESCGNDHYRYRVGFEIEERDHQELYDRAEAVAAELGLSENRNNSRGPDGDPMLYGAGLAEDRLFQVNTVTGKLSVFYRGRCSDHETMQKVVQDFGDQRLEELEENAPTHLPGYGE